MDTVVLAYSGGLDTSVAIKWIKEKYALDVIALTIDLGSERNLPEIKQRALDVGAIDAKIVDGREMFLKYFAFPALPVAPEPTTRSYATLKSPAVDPQSAEDVLRTVNDLRADLGLTIVAAEHRLDRLAPYADRVMHIPRAGEFAVMNTRCAMSGLPGAPVVSRIGASLGWSPLPLSIVEARPFVGRRADTTTLAGVAKSESGKALVEVQGIEVELGGVTVLRGVSLRLERGQVTAVMGRNGAGKTTLLRAIAGLMRPVRGAIRSSIPGIEESRYRHLAFVAQDPSSMLYHASPRDEIRDVLRGTGRSGDVEATLIEWNLTDVAHRDPRDLSVGERQRVALAAMLCGAPELILLDEPTRGMDTGTKDLLVANLRRRAAAGASVAIASHDVELAARCADRVVLLADGDVIADGAARSVLTDSLVFTTQANKLVGGDVLTAEDAIACLGAPA